MLLELAVRDLGVIDEAHLVLTPGMNVLTGETGAGKTLVVDAIELLVGGRADAIRVRSGADEAWIEGRFLFDEDGREALARSGNDPEYTDDEVVVTRVVPRTGRSRAYVNGRLATVGGLADIGRHLVDLHGQHAHQSLLSGAAQRAALDRFGTIDIDELDAARRQLRQLTNELAALGGDERARAREIDLLRYQVDELDAAQIVDPNEDERLAGEEDVLADAAAHRLAAAQAMAALTDEGGATDPLGAAIGILSGRSPFATQEERLRSLAVEISDVAGELRDVAESIDEDPARLAGVRERRQLLFDLRRKYGETLEDVMVEADRLRSRLDELRDHDRRAAVLDEQIADARKTEAAVAAKVAGARRAAAPRLAAEVEGHLRQLALPKARLEVRVDGEDPGDDVAFLLSANPGTEPLPLTKIASGGELARTMLALRLVLTTSPPTLVFDEVDAGIGGQAADAVGRALGGVAHHRQVLVVTHLPQVAAYADAHLHVSKHSHGRATVARVAALDGDGRVVELSRMLSGLPESETARRHAEELLARGSAGKR